jgi:hypothetical protein
MEPAFLWGIFKIFGEQSKSAGVRGKVNIRRGDSVYEGGASREVGRAVKSIDAAHLAPNYFARSACSPARSARRSARSSIVITLIVEP